MLAILGCSGQTVANYSYGNKNINYYLCVIALSGHALDFKCLHCTLWITQHAETSWFYGIALEFFRRTLLNFKYSSHLKSRRQISIIHHTPTVVNDIVLSISCVCDPCTFVLLLLLCCILCFTSRYPGFIRVIFWWVGNNYSRALVVVPWPCQHCSAATQHNTSNPGELSNAYGDHKCIM